MILTELTSEALVITINRPEKKNALTPQMYQAMADAIQNIKYTKARALLIQGSNSVFCSGNDIAEFNTDEPLETTPTYAFMQALFQCKVPVVAKVEGVAVGIGATMLLHCDFVYTHVDTKFAMPFINLGLVPEYASSYLLPRLGGYLQAAKILMLGEIFSAQQALDCRLVTDICNEDLDQKVQQTLYKLSQKPSSALQTTKALLRSNEQIVQERINVELKAFSAALESAPAQEAFSAFLAKREINQTIFRQ